MTKARKILATILSVLTLISVFSVALPVVAADLQNSALKENSSIDVYNTTEDVSSEELSASSAADPFVIGEDESRRTADTKHFIMSDGSMQAVIYGNAVHYKENGKWQDIDNTLTYDKDKKEYRNKNNSFKATFKEDFNDENMFSLESNGYVISWKYEGNSLSKAVIKAEHKDKKNSGNNIMKHAEKTEDIIRYKNFESECELEYIVTSNGVKENIILNSKSNKNTFMFKLTAQGLTLLKNENGSISALDPEKKEVFYLPAPFMYDSKGICSYNVSYEIAGKNGVYTITVVADKEWLNDNERVYPVIIDPVIYTKQTSTSVSSTFVTSALPTANYGSRHDIYIGTESSNYGKCHAMFKNTLPTLNKGDMVVGAYLNLYLNQTSFSGGSNTRQLDAHVITSSWAENSVTWETKPTYDSKIIDFCFMENGVSNWQRLDITKAVKCWYEGIYANYGILIKSNVETEPYARAIFCSENATSSNGYTPYIAIVYRNNKGIESYWSYTSFSNGIGGTASINDYSGNLVYSVPLASSVSEIMPVTLGIVYNNYCSNEIYTAGKDNLNTTSVGRGWRLNYQQTLLTSQRYGLTGDDAINYPYVYTDADGTEHYIAKFIENGQTVYKDEDGLGYTFTMPNGTNDYYRLTQEDGSYMSFNNCGNLSEIVDNSGNKITLTYDSTNKKLTKITDGTGHTFSFTYTSGTNYLSSIQDNAGRVTTLAISNSTLTDVSLIDGSRVYFRYYTTDDKPLNYVWSTDGIGRSFAYTTRTKASRVYKTTAFSATNVDLAGYVLGQITTFDRSLYNTTVIRTAGIDGIHNTTDSAHGSDDIMTTLQFDNFGRTVSQQVKYNNGTSVGAGSYTYTDNDAEESRNRITSTAVLNKNTANLLFNPSVESTSNWTLTGKVGDVSYTYDCTADEAYFGTKSLKITNTSLTKNSYAYVGQLYMSPKIGSYYTLSAYIKTNITNIYDYSDIQGAYLKVVARNSSNTALLLKESPIVKNTTSEEINDGWRRISVTFQIPEDTTKLEVFMMLGNATGTAYFDGFQLEEGTSPNSTNLIQNGSFEKYSTTGITGWTANGFTYAAGTNGITTTSKKDGSAAVRLEGSGSAEKCFYQIVPVSPNPNDTYIVSGWASAFAVNNTFHQDTEFEIAVEVTYSCSDGTTKTQLKNPAKFNSSVANWQYASSAFVLAYEKESGDTKTYTPTQIKIMPSYNRQANYTYFDHIQLIKDVASSYIYDSEGNVTSVSANAEQKNNMTYEGEDLKTYVDAAGNTTTYTYDDKHRLTQVKSPKEVKQNYIYNTRGQVETVEIENVGGGAKIQTTNTYTGAYTSGTTNLSAGAYLYKTTNELGKTTIYGHNLPTGASTSVEDAKGNKTFYGYNTDYTRLLRVDSAGTSVLYSYDGNKIDTISFGYGTDNTYNEIYSFVYDSFGNVTQTKVGSTALVTNTYGVNDGVLQKSTYANGDAIRYQYNNSGQVIGIYQDNNAVSSDKAFVWLHSSNGTPVVHKDANAGLRYDYSYDSIGRLIRTDISDNSSLAYVGSTEYGYDVRNNLTSVTNDIGGVVYTQLYGYGPTGAAGSAESAKDNLPTIYTALNVSTNYYYNGLNQLTQRTVGASSNPITNLYTYNRNGSNYTNQLATEYIAGTKYHYTYDDVGNIISVKKSVGSGAQSNYRDYTYDGLNRMLTEKNYTDKQIVSYTYNHLGNITEKQIDTYTDASLQGSYTRKIIKYTYGNDGKTGWSYLLTSYDADSDNIVDTNEKISYDEIGNPITYRGATLSWYGRQMKSFAKNGITSTMTYDADGLRSSKTVAGVKTTYQYVDDKLFYENRGNGDSFYYFYDSYGKLSAIYHHRNGTKVAYHVATNAQGDVVGLYNWSGSLVASYEYDAWGNCTIVSDSTSTKIATLNPFRYRSYYYDTETGLYYVSSRYYDPEIGRFISPDTTDVLTAIPMGLTDKNLYAYCDNNPVVRADHGGDFWHIVVGAAAGALISGVVKPILNAIEGKSLTDGLATAMLSGAASGALATTSFGIEVIIAGNAVISMVENTANQLIENKGFKNFDVNDMLIDGVIGGLFGAFGGKGKGSKHLTNLGKQTVKRTIDATSHNGLKAGFKEAGKAFAYYGKNTMSYCKRVVNGFLGDTLTTTGAAIASSDYMKNQYNSAFGG